MSREAIHDPMPDFDIENAEFYRRALADVAISEGVQRLVSYHLLKSRDNDEFPSANAFLALEEHQQGLAGDVFTRVDELRVSVQASQRRERRWTWFLGMAEAVGKAVLPYSGRAF